MKARRKHTLHERLDHLFYLMWKRDERINRRLRNIMTQAEDLTREIQETRDAVGAVAVKMQELLDIIAQNPNNSQAVADAITALNEIQTQLATLSAPKP